MDVGVKTIQDHSLRISEDGFDILVRLNYHRSIPLSCIENISLQVNNHTISHDNMTLTINKHTYTVDELPDLIDEFWYVQDAIKLHISQPRAVWLGYHYNVNVELSFRLPDVVIGDEQLLQNTGTCSSILVAY